MAKNTRKVTIFIQLICWGSIVSFLFLWKGSAQAKLLFQVTTPEPFFGSIYYDQAAVWKVFDHNLPVARPFEDGNFDVVHYDGSIHYAVTATAVPGATATPATTPAPAPYVPGEYGYDQHLGIDYGLQYQPVLAAASGIVETAGWSNPANHRAGYGLHVVMSHSENSNYTTWYGHLSSLTVEAGDKICIEDPVETSDEICINNFIEPNDRRRILGISGNTGNVFNSSGNTCGNVENNSSCGQHLHFEVRYNGRVVNPYGWVATADPNGTPIFDPWSIHANGATSYNLWATPPAVTSSQYQANGPILDAPPLPTPYITVDNSDAEYSEIDNSGSPNPEDGCFQTETGGYNGDFRYMEITDFTGTPPTPTCLARWAVTPPNGATPNDDLYYDVYVHIPNTTAHTLTRGAVYSVWHRPDATSPLKESQAIVVQAVFPNDNYQQNSPWVYIGRYFFTLDGTEYIEVGNVTLDGDVAGYVVAVDAIQLSANTLPPVNTATPSPSATSTTTPASTPTPSGTPTIAATPSSTPDPNYLTQISDARGGRVSAISDDGRYIAYGTDDDTGTLIRYDRITGVAEAFASGVWLFTSQIDISEDGRYIVYSAYSAGGSNYSDDVFLFDYQTGLTENISSAILPPSPNDILWNNSPRIAVVNGSPIVVFTSRLNWANNTIYLYQPGQPLAEINPTHLPGVTTKVVLDISKDGNEILYKATSQLFLFDRTTSTVQTIQPLRLSRLDMILSARFSDDETSSFVAYEARYDLCNFTCWYETDIYLFDRNTDSTEQIAFKYHGWPSGVSPQVSSDGRFVYYAAMGKIYVYDRVSTLLRVVVQQGFNDQSNEFAISSNGNFVVFPLDGSDGSGNNTDYHLFLVDMSLWSPPAVPTPTPIPTATATPVGWWTDCFFSTVLADDGSGVYVGKPLNRFWGKMQQTTELLSLLYRLRDDVLSQTEQGLAYTSLYETHTAEVTNLVLADSDLFQQAVDTATMFTPHLQDFLDGDGTNVIVTAAEVQAIQDFLDNVVAAGSPALQQTIAQERINLPLENFIGLTPNDAWAQFHSGTNLLQNGGFESGIAPWNNNGSLSISTDAFLGNNALQVGSDANASQAISVIGSGQTYTFSGYAKRSGSQWAGIGIDYFDSLGSIISQQNLPITSVSYEYFSLSVAAPANAVMMAVWANNTAGGQLYLDELSLIIDLNPPTPTPTATATSSSSNLLQNPDFEQGTTPWVAGASANMDITSDAFAGNNALRLGDATNAYQSVPGVIEGWTYTFSGYAKRSGSQWAGIGMNFFDANNNQISIQNVPITAANYGAFTLSMVAPEGAVKVHTWASNSAGAGFLFLDTLSLLASPNPSPTATYTPTPTAASTFAFTPTFTPSPTATLLSTVTPTPSFTTTPTSSATPTTLPTITPTPPLTTTPTPASGSTFLFTPVADAFVAAQQPAANQGGSSTIRTDLVPENLSYLKFDVQNLDGVISGAKLRLFVLDTNAFGFNIHRVADNSWAENTITYNTRPTIGLFINTSGAVSANSWVEVDVTEYVTGEGLFTFALTATNDAVIRYRSRETSSAPELIIETGSGVPPTATPLPTSTATATTGLPPTSTPTPMPTLTPTATNVPTSTSTPLPGNTVTFNPTADAFVSANQPTGNQGSSFLLRTNTVPDTRSYLKFDVQSLSGNVASATLRIFALDAVSSGFEVYAVPDNSWGENTITFNTVPATGMFITSSGATTANSWLEVDVTSFVTGNGEWSVVLIGADNNTIRYRSRESNASPELVIVTGTGLMNAEQAVERVSTANAGKNQFE